MKKFLVLLLVLALALTAFVGCGGSNTEEPAEEPAAGDQRRLGLL